MTPPSRPTWLRSHARPAAAIVLVLAAYAMTAPPEPSAAARAALAANFRFERLTLPTVGPASSRTSRDVHPARARFGAWISAVGAGVALHDLDGDGLPNDACTVDTRTDDVVVSPVPGTGARYAPFALEPGALVQAATMAPMGCLPSDLDEDGRADLIVYYWGRTPLAFLRRDTAAAAASYAVQELVPGDQRWFSNAATIADVDGDGHGDLILGNYFPDGQRVLDASATTPEQMQHSMSRAANGAGARLFLWAGRDTARNGAVRYREVPNALNLTSGRGWTLALAAADLDGDLLPEIYVANDFGPDHLLHNLSKPGAPRFALLEGSRSLAVPRSKVLGRDSFKGMGADFADLNGDGILDLFVSNLSSEYALMENNFLFLGTGDRAGMQDGEAPFVERAEALGLARSGWSWDARIADMNNDGVPEAMQAVGFLKGTTNRWPELQELAIANDQLLRHPGVWPSLHEGDDLSGGESNTFFVRADDGRYYDLSRDIGFGDPMVSRAIALADVDGDGRLDLAVGNQWADSYFYHNLAPKAGQFLGLHLMLPVGQAATRVIDGHPDRATAAYAAIGAQAVVHLPNGTLGVAQVDGGNGHSGKRSPDLHFGLGSVASGQAMDVDVRWRDAGGQVRRQTFKLAPGWHTIILGQGGRS